MEGEGLVERGSAIFPKNLKIIKNERVSLRKVTGSRGNFRRDLVDLFSTFWQGVRRENRSWCQEWAPQTAAHYAKYAVRITPSAEEELATHASDVKILEKLK
jgi:hypothetical protein